MKKRTDDFELLKNMLSRKTEVSDLPQEYTYKIDKQKKSLVLTLSKKGLTANMQDNGSALESWAIALRFYLDDIIQTVTIDWETIPNTNISNLHFNRFVYRLSLFVQTYDWVLSANPIPQIPSVLVCNFPNGEAANTKKHKEGSEGWIECKYIEKYGLCYDTMDHQLPVGIFHDKVSKNTHYTTGKKSAIDIWAIKDKNLYIFELKKPGNNVLGIISELMFYTNVIHDIMSHRIRYQYDAKMQVALKRNFRGFRNLYKAYTDGEIKNINAIILADTTHPLIQSSLLNFINDSARLKYCRIYYSMEKVEL